MNYMQIENSEWNNFERTNDIIHCKLNLNLKNIGL